MKDETSNLFTLLTHTADGAFVVGENQRILFWNAAAQELLGFTATEVLGRPCCEILCGHEDQGFPFCRSQCPVVTHTKTGQTIPNFDLWVRTRAGARRWVNLSILASPQEQASPLIISQISAALSLLQGPDLIPELLQTVTPADNIELSDREREVLSLLAQGLSTNAIAESLTISTTTARNHIQNILSKLHVHSQLQAVLYALQHHLFDTES